MAAMFLCACEAAGFEKSRAESAGLEREKRWKRYRFSIKMLNIHWNAFLQGNDRFGRIGMHGDSIHYFRRSILKGFASPASPSNDRECQRYVAELKGSPIVPDLR